MEKIACPLSAAVFTALRLAAPADTNGKAKVSVEDIDDSGDLIGSNRGGYWDVVNNGSKLGIKGFSAPDCAAVLEMRGISKTFPGVKAPDNMQLRAWTGALFGALIISTLNNGLTLMNVSLFWQFTRENVNDYKGWVTK
ncbi:MAG TPA: hypothetical protein PLP22_02930 [Candidatus Competibacter sp.]|nr:hypothetical protein [Candidatus Competibacter sp.]HUM94195.1 hypothetical protein [Candidatus Competibacter sp.]